MYDRLADLAVTVDDWTLDRHEADTSSGFTRVSTVFELDGDGRVGRGEDVTYDTVDHDRLHEAVDGDGGDPPELPTGTFAFEEFSEALDDVALFPEPPDRPTSRHYRRWAVESAALDLALRQAETNLAAALDRTYDPVRFVASTRLDEDGGEPSADRVHALRDAYPGLELKLDPTPAWDASLVSELAATDAVRIVDLKGYYENTDVDQDADPDFYRRVVEGFPDAIVEDARWTDATEPILEPAADRLSWDKPIEGLADVEALPVDPAWLNVKPSRFGTVESLLATVEWALDRGVSLYGGGQFELGVGRQHLHALASLFYPDGPNDVAPRGYNDPDVRTDLPSSPLAPRADPVGLAWRYLQ
ncbi:MAG: hypothetical protein ABEI96_10440 [Haloarculaceae archaeon]